jgi:multidrug efflux pump subunit AcrA (membrane-fusion protein)
VLVALIAVGAWFFLQPRPDTAGLVKGNGRIEATEIDVPTKIAGRVRDVLVDEGDFVEAGKVLANIQSDTLQSQFAEAEAQRQLSHRERNRRLRWPSCLNHRDSPKAPVRCLRRERTGPQP